MNTSNVGWLVNFRPYNILQKLQFTTIFVTRISPHLRGSVTPCTLESETHEKMVGMEFSRTDSGRHACHYEGHKTRKHILCHKFLLCFFCSSFVFQHHFLLTIVGYQSHHIQQSTKQPRPSVAAAFEPSEGPVGDP